MFQAISFGSVFNNTDVCNMECGVNSDQGIENSVE